MKPEFTVIRINAKTSFERGVQYGRQAKQQDHSPAEQKDQQQRKGDPANITNQEQVQPSDGRQAQ